MTAIVVALLWKRFICKACGLIYDEAKGDADSGIAAGTRFDDIPDDWACPLCGVTKADFEPYADVPLPRRATPAPSHAAGARGSRRPGVVIVGAGRAGWVVAEALRDRDADMPVTLVTACDGAVYDKPLLSVALAHGVDPGSLVREAAASAAQRLGVRLLADTHAVSVSAAARRLRTTRGALPYAHLVLAHGALPRDVPQLPGALCWRINDRATYVRFRAALGPPQWGANDIDSTDATGDAGDADVLIAGAGLVGCELANDLALAGYCVTLLDIAQRPLASLLDPERSTRLLDAWRDLPIRFAGGVQIQSVVRDGPISEAPLTVIANDGRHFQARHVLAATGLKTPSRLAASAGLAWANGIAVDATTLATSDPHIHALGDCISIDGQPVRYIEPIARQARSIADRITGRAVAAYNNTRPPTRIKTTSLPMTA